MGEDNLGGTTLQSSSQMQLQHCAKSSDELDLEYSSESTVVNNTECILISRIRATNVAVDMRHIPVWFYVAVGSGSVIKRTSNEPVSAGGDMVEWDDEIVLPPDRSSRISLTVFASFELGPTLREGEVLRKFEITVGELLDCDGQLERIGSLEHDGEEAIPPSLSLEIEIKRPICSQNKYAAASNLPDSEGLHQLEESTNRGHRALILYCGLQEQRDLAEAIRHFQYARDVCPLDHPSLPTVLFNLATVKLICCRANDTSPDFDVPISLYRATLRLRPRGHPDHPSTLLSLGIAIEARFQRQYDEADRAQSRTLLSQALDVALVNSYAYYAAILALSSIANSELVQQMGIPRTVEDDGEVQRLNAALQWMFYPDSSRHGLPDYLAVLFYAPSNHPCDVADPENGISMLEVVLQFTSGDHPDKPVRLNRLGSLLWTRYKRFGDVVDLQRSISIFEDMVHITPDGYPDKYSFFNNLGNAMLSRYDRLGDIADLKKSICWLEDAAQSTPDDHPDKSLRLTNLANSLLTRYDRFGNIIDLERSISVFEDAAQLIPNGHPDKPSWLTNLGNSLLTRYERFGDVIDLERSISMFEAAAQLTPIGHLYKHSRLNNLGGALLTRYKCFGDIFDLEKSISMRIDAARFTPDGHPDMSSLLNNLGNSLLTRYQRFGDVLDLDRAISMFDDAVHFAPDGHPDIPAQLNNLGNALSIRFERLGDIVDLQRSISVFEDAVKFTPEGHPDKRSFLVNLGNSLLTRYELFGDVIDLDRTILMLDDAVHFAPDGHPGILAQLNNLANALLIRHGHFGGIADLEREDAVQFTRPIPSYYHPHRSRSLPRLHMNSPLTLPCPGLGTEARFQRQHDEADLDPGVDIRFHHPVRPVAAPAPNVPPPADGTENRTLRSQVLDVAPLDYQCPTALLELDVPLSARNQSPVSPASEMPDQSSHTTTIWDRLPHTHMDDKSGRSMFSDARPTMTIRLRHWDYQVSPGKCAVSKSPRPPKSVYPPTNRPADTFIQTQRCATAAQIDPSLFHLHPILRVSSPSNNFPLHFGHDASSGANHRISEYHLWTAAKETPTSVAHDTLVRSPSVISPIFSTPIVPTYLAPIDISSSLPPDLTTPWSSGYPVTTYQHVPLPPDSTSSPVLIHSPLPWGMDPLQDALFPSISVAGEVPFFQCSWGGCSTWIASRNEAVKHHLKRTHVFVFNGQTADSACCKWVGCSSSSQKNTLVRHGLKWLCSVCKAEYTRRDSLRCHARKKPQCQLAQAIISDSAAANRVTWINGDNINTGTLTKTLEPYLSSYVTAFRYLYHVV